MKKLILTLGLTFAGLLVGPAAQAQNDAAGEARAAPSKPQTKEERAAARAKRQSGNKETAKSDAGRADAPNSQGVAKGNTKEEKQAARAKRQAEGKELAKKDEGRLEDNPTPKK